MSETVNVQQQVQQRIDMPDSVYRNRYLILAIIMIGMFMGMLDGTMVNIALPTITSYYDVSIVQSEWAITGYLLAMTGLFIFFGKLSEFTGKAKLFIAGYTVFTISSLACGLSANLGQLIAFRIVQGIGASMVSGVAGALIYQAFPPQERGKAMGLFGVVIGVGALIGPGLGGFLVDSFTWQYLFFVNVPIGVVLLACALKYLKVPETISKNFEMDWWGAGALAISVVSLMLFLEELAKYIEMTGLAIAYGAIFALSLVGFIFRESRCKKPLLDLSIFGNKKFLLPILSAMLYSITLNLAGILGPFYLEGVMEYTPSQVGLLFMVPPFILMIVAPIGGILYDKHHWKYMAGAGVLIASVSFVLLGYGFFEMNLALILMAFVLRGIGGGLFTSPNNVEIMSALPVEKTAIASSVSSTTRFTAAMLGVSLSTILLTLLLNMSGHSGQVLQAGLSLMANSIGTIMIIGAVLCLISTVISILRNVGGTSGPAGKGQQHETDTVQ